MDKRITIQNLDKIRGQHLFSKWLPKTIGWVVRDVEPIGDTYRFELACSKGGWKTISVQLRRDVGKYEPNRREFLYELWAWGKDGKPEQIWMIKPEMNSTNEMALRLGMMIEKII